MIALSGVGLRSHATGALVLDGVDLALGAGEVAVVSGPTSAGKSALVRVACRLIAPERGAVAVFGRDLGRLTASSLARLRRRLGVALDDPLLLDDDSALDNVALALEIAGVSARERLGRAAAALDRVGLAALGAVPVGRLSAGQRRGVALARALVVEPAVLLLDQPTAELDGDGRARVIALVGEHAAAGGAALLATSDPMLVDAADLLAWQVHELDGGQLRRAGLIEPADGRDTAPLEVVVADGEPLPNVVPFPRSARLGGPA